MKTKRSKSRNQINGLVVAGMMVAIVAAMVTEDALPAIITVAIFMPIVGYLSTRLPEHEENL